MAQGILSSPEYRTVTVRGLYGTLLHRAADPMELADGVAFLAKGGTGEQLQALLAGSVEYVHNRGGGSTDGFLDVLYRDTLHRAPDAGGRAAYAQALASGSTRAQIADALFCSREYQQDLVQSAYRRFLRRDADSNGLNSFMNLLQRGERDEAVLAGIVGSPEFLKNTAAR